MTVSIADTIQNNTNMRIKCKFILRSDAGGNGNQIPEGLMAGHLDEIGQTELLIYLWQTELTKLKFLLSRTAFHIPASESTNDQIRLVS